MILSNNAFVVFSIFASILAHVAVALFFV